jgi:hypothetical protein
MDGDPLGQALMFCFGYPGLEDIARTFVPIAR